MERQEQLFLLGERRLEKLQKGRACSKRVRVTSRHSGVGNDLMRKMKMIQVSKRMNTHKKSCLLSVE